MLIGIELNWRVHDEKDFLLRNPPCERCLKYACCSRIDELEINIGFPDQRTAEHILFRNCDILKIWLELEGIEYEWVWETKT